MTTVVHSANSILMGLVNPVVFDTPVPSAWVILRCDSLVVSGCPGVFSPWGAVSAIEDAVLGVGKHDITSLPDSTWHYAGDAATVSAAELLHAAVYASMRVCLLDTHVVSDPVTIGLRLAVEPHEAQALYTHRKWLLDHDRTMIDDLPLPTSDDERGILRDDVAMLREGCVALRSMLGRRLLAPMARVARVLAEDSPRRLVNGQKAVDAELKLLPAWHYACTQHLLECMSVG